MKSIHIRKTVVELLMRKYPTDKKPSMLFMSFKYDDKLNVQCSYNLLVSQKHPRSEELEERMLNYMKKLLLLKKKPNKKVKK